MSNTVAFIRPILLFNYNVVKARRLTQCIIKQSGKLVHLSPTQQKIVMAPVRTQIQNGWYRRKHFDACQIRGKNLTKQTIKTWKLLLSYTQFQNLLLR